MATKYYGEFPIGISNEAEVVCGAKTIAEAPDEVKSEEVVVVVLPSDDWSAWSTIAASIISS